MYLKPLITLFFLSTFFLFAETIGNASWYGEKFQGKSTASGEAFDMYSYTAAHRTLPFGTILKVTNLSNSKSVNVRINDRGPFKENRIIDLSYQAAKEIGLVKEGVAKVSIEELSDKEQSLKSMKKAEIKSNSSSNDNPYITDEEQEYMKNYTTKAVSKNIYNSKDEYSDIESNTKSVKLQIAAFSSRKNAKKFIEDEHSNGFNMEIVEVYLESIKKRLYKVLILCESDKVASAIIDSKKYVGAYRFH